mgnify:CR=1 FL=1
MIKSAIITAASESYAKQLLALLGSLEANWPSHPPVVVYDLGLPISVVDSLESRNVEVREVPEFCPHWRQHFTWKIWCWNDIDAETFLWIDAGAIVLSPLEEVFPHIKNTGYLVVPNYRLLVEEASEEACIGCDVDPSFREGKTTLAGNFIGFNKTNELISVILKKALELALVEKNIKATDPKHRHDQALISLLIYKNVQSPLMLDGNIYLGGPSPILVPGQKIWACRRGMNKSDIENFSNYFLNPNAQHPPFPESPQKFVGWLLGDVEYQINRIYGLDKEYIDSFLLLRGLSKRGKRIFSLILKAKNNFRSKKNNKSDALNRKGIYDGIRD